MENSFEECLKFSKAFLIRLLDKGEYNFECFAISRKSLGE